VSQFVGGQVLGETTRQVPLAVREHMSDGLVRATDWADLPDRMKYVFALFAGYHTRPEVIG